MKDLKFKVIDKPTGKELKIRALQFDKKKKNKLMTVIADFPREKFTRIYTNIKSVKIPEIYKKFNLKEVEVSVI